MNRLQEKYNKEIRTELMKEMGLKNPMAVPVVEKVIVNMKIGKFKDNASYIESASRDLGAITGQKPVPRGAKKAIANFRLRAGEPVGLMVTLRGERMWIFLDKLFNVVLPRVKDFRGVSPKSFDGRGNYSFGIAEQTAFAEIDPNKVDSLKSLGITISTTAQDNESGKLLLEKLGAPFVGRKK